MAIIGPGSLGVVSAGPTTPTPPTVTPAPPIGAQAYMEDLTPGGSVTVQQLQIDVTTPAKIAKSTQCLVLKFAGSYYMQHNVFTQG